MLRPQEIERRRAALQRYLANSALTAPNMAAAGVIPTPAAKTSPVEDKLPPRDAGKPASAAAFLPRVRCVVSYAFARKWAEENGILAPRQALDLRAANALRLAQGLPAFALKGEC